MQHTPLHILIQDLSDPPKTGRPTRVVGPTQPADLLRLPKLQEYVLWFNFILGSNFISILSNSSSNYHNQNKGNKI